MTNTAISYGTLSVDVGEPNHVEEFSGHWLVAPDEKDTRSIVEGLDAGTYFGVAQTEKGNIAVYVAHCNERWPAQLHVYPSLDEAVRAGAVPSDLEIEARGALGQTIWRDI